MLSAQQVAKETCKCGESNVQAMKQPTSLSHSSGEERWSFELTENSAPVW